MAKKEFSYRGKSLEELKKMGVKEFAQISHSYIRRKLKRGFTEKEKKLMAKLEKGGDNIKTHCRELPIIPVMVGKKIRVYNGKEFVPITIEAEMLGHRLGEMALTRKMVAHSAPGVGATRSSANISVK